MSRATDVLFKIVEDKYYEYKKLPKTVPDQVKKIAKAMILNQVKGVKQLIKDGSYNYSDITPEMLLKDAKNGKDLSISFLSNRDDTNNGAWHLGGQVDGDDSLAYFPKTDTWKLYNSYSGSYTDLKGGFKDAMANAEVFFYDV